MSLALSPLVLPARRHVLAAALWWGAACCAALSVAFAQEASAGELREVETFRALDLRTAAQVEVRLGERQSVEIEAEPSAAALVETQVSRGTLIVRDRETIRLSPMPPVRVLIVAKRLDAVSVGSVTRLTLDKLQAAEFSLTLGGSSAAKLGDVDVKRLQVQTGGSSALTLSGRTGDLTVALGGSSSVEASALAAKTVSLSGGGSSKARVWASDILSASLSGASSARYFGQPVVSLSTSGVATLTRLDDAPPAAR